MEVVKKEQLSTNVDTTDRQPSTFKRHEVKNAPFEIIEMEIEKKQKFFGTLGESRLTEPYDTLEKCKKELTKMTWNRIAQVIMVTIDSYNKVQNTNN